MARGGGAWWALWLLVHAGLVARGLATGEWPWAMFDRPATIRTEFVLEARVDGGDWERLPLDALFRYRRGFTRLTRLHDSPAMYGVGATRLRKRFVRWAVAELAPDAGYDEARLLANEVEVRGRETHVREVAVARMQPGAAE